MDNFDEYQKLMRYKYGAHSFVFLIVLIMMNFLLFNSLEVQWAESKELEFVLLTFIAVGYFIMMSVYKGAYFHNKYNPAVYASIFFLLGLMNIYLSMSARVPLIVDGLIMFNSIMLLSGILWISIPAAYLTRVLVEKRRDSENTDEE